ncbi:MAG: SpoIVB peptidase S55 domain-containing protein [Armatimonadota bacterium]
MKRLSWLFCLLLLLLGAWTSSASAQLAWDPKEFMGVDEITPGMVGYGKTVYQGTKIEKFDIEVIGVLKKVDFGFDMILVKVTSGPVVERKLQTVEGMSGSPIYIDDRLIGAYAYGWNFQQEPIAGVTPIASMLECTQPGTVVTPLVGSLVPRKGVITIGNKVISRIKVAPTQSEAALQQAKADPTTMVLSPVATPIFVSGMPDAAIKPMQKLFDSYNIRALPGPGQVDGEAPALEAGSAVGVSLMEGDANLTAVGTVTYVKGDTVLCFGHPFMGAGKVNMPMSAAYVHGIVNSGLSSFKMASPMGRVGTATSDRQFALAGITGQKPDTLPVTISLTDSSRNFTRRYAVDMVNDYHFTPVLFYLYVLFNGASQMGDFMADEGTFTARAIVSTDKFGNIEQNLVVAPQMSDMPIPMAELYFLTDLLMQNPYEPVKLTNIFVDVKHTPERNIATIEKVTPDRLVARPGEMVNLDVSIRPFGKPLETRRVTVTVPKYAPEPVMLVAVAGGTLNFMLKPLLQPTPTPEEGVKGLIRWFTDNPKANSVLVAQALPSPSYGYRGSMLRNVPMAVLDMLRISETGLMDRGNSGGDSESPNQNEEQGRGAAPGGEGVRPTTYLSVEDAPYVLSGGQVVMIAVDTEERAVQSVDGKFDFNLNVPLLSTGLSTSRVGPKDGSDERYESSFSAGPWFTPQQQARAAMLIDSFKSPTMRPVNLQLPTLRMPSFNMPNPLSLSLSGLPKAGREVGIEAKPGAPSVEDSKGGKGERPSDVAPGEGDDDNGSEDGDEGPAADSAPSAATADGALLTHKQYSWGLTSRKDFLRGKHLGTGVTSKGRLVLVPSVKSVYQSTEIVPWKMVSTAAGTYVAGWNSPKVARLTGDGKSETVYPQQAADAAGVVAVSALAADANGNLLVATWPDQKVRLVKPDGSVTKTWTLPGSSIWDLAVATDGKRYAACDQGTLLILRDDEQAPLQAGCIVPDKHVYALATGNNGEVYLATSPRGKVYRLSANGIVASVFEARSEVTSLAVDRQGNLYVGTSPRCQVICVSPDGTQHEVMRGAGRGNRHVLSLKVAGNDLFAATGPAGGIYHIINPAGQDPEVAVVFAREDARDGSAEDSKTGPESVMVNALALTQKGEVLAAASTPGQVLQLLPRGEGAFLSSVLQTPTVAKWGQIDIHVRKMQGETVTVESRSGYTAVPDDTWSDWQQISKDEAQLASAPALFAQFRVQMTAEAGTTPMLEYARLFYQPVNQAPMLKLDQPKVGIFWSGTKDIRWEAKDPDGDELIYTAFVSSNDGQTWMQLQTSTTPKKEGAEAAPPAPAPANGKADAKKPKDDPKKDKAPAAPVKDDPKAEKPETAKPNSSETNQTNIGWDTKSMADGVYRIKVIASDKYARPTDAKSAEIISGRFAIDNTPPVLAIADKVYTWEEIKRVQIVDNLLPIIGGKYRIDDGPWTALVAEDGIFNSRKKWVLLVTPNGDPTLTNVEHKVTIQAKDAADNLLNRTIILAIGQKPPAPPAPVAKVNSAPVDDNGFADLLLQSLEN